MKPPWWKRPGAPPSAADTLAYIIVVVGLAVLEVQGAISRWAYLAAILCCVAVWSALELKAGASRGVYSVDETPRRWLRIIRLPLAFLLPAAGFVGGAAALVTSGYFVLSAVGERIVWRRFDETRDLTHL